MRGVSDIRNRLYGCPADRTIRTNQHSKEHPCQEDPAEPDSHVVRSLRGAGGVAFVGASLAALKLPFFSRLGSAAGPGGMFRQGRVGDRQAADHLELAGLHRPDPQGRVDGVGLREADRHQRPLHRRRQRQRRVLRQGEEPARVVPVDQARHDRAHRLDGRPDDRARLDPAARPQQDAELHQEPHPAAARQALGPRPEAPRPLAERSDRHRLQRRQDRGGQELHRAPHPLRPQGQGHAAHRDARHDGLHAPHRRTRTRRTSPRTSGRTP